MHPQSFITLLLAVTLLAACKKEDNETNRKAEILGKWKYNGFMYDVNGNGQRDDSLYTLPDSFTYYYTFRNDGIVEIATGQTMDTTSWLLLDNDTKLRIGSDSSEIVDIAELNGTNLILGALNPKILPPTYGWFIMRKQ